MKRKGTLTRKFILGFMLIGVVISIISIFVGVNGYASYIKRQYNDTAYDIAETVQGFFEDDELLRYAELVKELHKEQDGKRYKEIMETERYQSVQKQINRLRDCMGANDIFVVYVDMDALDAEDNIEEDWAPLHYIFDTYVIEDKSYVLGDAGPFNPEFMEDIRWQLQTGRRTSDYYISKSDFGYNTSAALPVRLGKEELSVLIGVEIPMSTLESAVTELSLHTLGTMIVVMVMVILLFVYYLYKTVICPIDIIAEETARFDGSVDGLSDRLPGIRTGDELQELAESVLRMEQGILEHVRNITKITADKERISTELNVATEIQADMLPRIFPAFSERQEFDIYASMTPAREIGGDFYDFFLLDDDHLVMTVGDVSGKGVPAALFMVIAKTLLKNQAICGCSPGQIFENVNDQLCENNEAEMFVTVWLGIMQISTGKVVAVNAGHEYPAIQRRDGSFELLRDRHGFVLGGLAGAVYQEYEFTIEPGGGLFLYTDGVAEATSDREELFGTDRMLEALNREPDASPDKLAGRVKAAIGEFVGAAPPFDDITMLSLRRGEMT